MSRSGNILFSGVGGQGILLASEITAYALLEAGLDTKKSEVHGMAQRGGLVVAHLRFGDKVYSPLIAPGTADFLVAFETMESVRYLPFLHKNSTVIVNTHKIPPPAVALGEVPYPDNILAEFTKRHIKTFLIDGFGIAKSVAESRSANLALVGALSSLLPIAEEIFIAVMQKRLPRSLEKNIAAFKAGQAITSK